MADIVNGIQINKLPEAASVSDEDILILENAERTQKVSVKKLAESMLSPSLLNLIIPKNAGAHNAIFRGKDLTSIYTVKQICDMISKGTFDDLFIGDFFDVTISTSFTQTETVRCVLAGFDMYLKNGDTDLRKHHAVIVPKNCFTKTHPMNSTNTTGVSANPDNPVGTSASPDAQKAAYLGSDMHQIVLPKYAAALQEVFGDHLLTYRDLLSNKTNPDGASMAGAGFKGFSSGAEWADTSLRLMSEVQINGSTVISSSFYDIRTANLQLPLFRLDPTAKVAAAGGTGDTRTWYWMSAVAASDRFAYIDNGGYSTANSSSLNGGVRPLFLIG